MNPHLVSLVVIVILLNVFSHSTVDSSSWGQSKSVAYDKKDCQNGHCHQQCHITPHAMEGPFYVPQQPFRANITEGKEGIPMRLELNLMDYHNNCDPVKDAEVHVWHPDALGVYSAYLGYYPLGKPGSKQITGDHAEPTDKSTFLRGIQKTNEKGKATFLTIFPGWYLHRALHMHFKVFIDGEDAYTGEVYFPEEISAKVATVKPYSSQKEPRAKNDDDWLFVRLEGFRSVANLVGDVNNGFVANLNVVLEVPFNMNEAI